MDRREFLKNAVASAVFSSIPGIGRASRLFAADLPAIEDNTNWASLGQKPSIQASSFVADPPWGYSPINALGDDLMNSWEADGQASGAWLEVKFPQSRPVSEIWVLPKALPRDVLGQDVYNLAYSRVQWFQQARHIHVTFADGDTVRAELRQTDYFQIISLPQAKQTSTVRLTVDDVWPKSGGKETGIGKVRIFAQKHVPSFQIDTYKMYDAEGEQPVQAATLQLINPGKEIRGSKFVVSSRGKVLKQVALAPMPASATTHQDVWIPAPFEDEVMEFAVISSSFRIQLYA